MIRPSRRSRRAYSASENFAKLCVIRPRKLAGNCAMLRGSAVSCALAGASMTGTPAVAAAVPSESSPNWRRCILTSSNTHPLSSHNVLRGLRLRKLHALSENRQLHQRERSAAARAVRVSERLAHLVMIVVRRLDQLAAFAGRPDGNGEITRLTLKFGRLIRAIGHKDRSTQLIEMALRAHRVLHLIGEPDKGAALGNAHGPEIVHAARADAAFHDIGRHAVIPFPVGDEGDGRQMRAGGAAADVESVRIGAERGGVLVNPGYGASHLGSHQT